MEIEDYVPRLILEDPGHRLSAREISEASEEEGPYRPDMPHRSNFFTMSESIKRLHYLASEAQKEHDYMASITIADPMDYLGKQADSTVEWNHGGKIVCA